jgi:hypothetical protein
VKRILFMIFAVVGLSATSPAHATLDASAQAEIEQLLTFVEKSGCTFIRGGDEADGTKARQHLAMKYDFAKSKLSTADQFVREIGTRSSMTGQPYKVRCAGAVRESGPWLQEELVRVRAKR